MNLDLLAEQNTLVAYHLSSFLSTPAEQPDIYL